MDATFYIKDTGYMSSDLSGEQDDWLVNQGEPIRIHITNVTINSSANAVITSQVNDSYYVPTVVSRELTKLGITCYVITDFAVNGSIYLYDKNTEQYSQISNPPVSAIVALFEQMIGKQSHFDLFVSDGSGITPDYFKQLPLYWLAQVKSYRSDSITPETHLNVKVLNYTVNKASNKRYDINLNVVVLP